VLIAIFITVVAVFGYPCSYISGMENGGQIGLFGPGVGNII
jgi:hypothetical protein